MTSLALPVLLLLSAQSVSGYTWNFQTAPEQCGNFSIAISGQGQPPYRVLILPFGPSPLLDNVEARRIIDQEFPGNSNSVTFQLKYPANSQFVAVVSDATGFGSGGTSVAAQVTNSNDNSCFDSSTNVKPLFVFSIEPANQIVQCEATRLWWDPATVQGTPNFLGVIPGGQSFAVPQSEISVVPSQGTGFSWTPSLRGGTTVLIVGGDARGNGTAGSSLNTVSSGINNNNTCLSDQSPSSTPGSPAGGSYPTSTRGAQPGGASGNNTGAIVGGVIGGVVLLIAALLLILFFRRRQRLQKKQKERPVDLLNSDEGDDNDTPGYEGAAARNELPQYYQPEPFMVNDPTIGSSSVDGHSTNELGQQQGRMSADGQRMSAYTMTTRSGTPDLLGAGGSTTSGGRKGGMRPLRPVNIIQHDDAGPSEAGVKEEEPSDTIELPPAYTNIRK